MFLSYLLLNYFESFLAHAFKKKKKKRDPICNFSKQWYFETRDLQLGVILRFQTSPRFFWKFRNWDAKTQYPFALTSLRPINISFLNSNDPKWEIWRSSLLISFQTGESFVTLWKTEIQISLSSVAITAHDAVWSGLILSLSSFGGHLAIKFKHNLLNIRAFTLVSNICANFPIPHFALSLENSAEPPQWIWGTKQQRQPDRRPIYIQLLCSRASSRAFGPREALQEGQTAHVQGHTGTVGVKEGHTARRSKGTRR